MDSKTGALLAVLACAPLGACSLGKADPCEGDPFISGPLTQTEEQSGQRRVLIEEDPDVDDPGDPGGDKLWLSIEHQTKLMVRLEDASLVRASEEDLRVGKIADGWITGAVLDSYPGQAVATCIAVEAP